MDEYSLCTQFTGITIDNRCSAGLVNKNRAKINVKDFKTAKA